MSRYKINISIIALLINFALFFTKLYVGISSNSLSIYCDAINNLGDSLSCVVAILGFVWSKKLSQQKSARAQSLCTFVISIVIGVTGAYFVYNGLERLLYPLPVAYSKKYAIVIASTILVKIFMGLLYIKANKKAPTPVFKAMVLDSFLDCAVTLFALMGLFLITKLNFSIDGIFAIIVGIFVTVSAVKNIIEQTKFLINN